MTFYYNEVFIRTYRRLTTLNTQGVRIKKILFKKRTPNASSKSEIILNAHQFEFERVYFKQKKNFPNRFRRLRVIGQHT